MNGPCGGDRGEDREAGRRSDLLARREQPASETLVVLFNAARDRH